MEEPQDDRYGVFKAKIETLLWRHAPAAYEKYEREGVLNDVLRRRALPLWNRLKRMRESGVDYVAAMEMIAREMYPPEAQPDEDEPWPW